MKRLATKTVSSVGLSTAMLCAVVAASCSGGQRPDLPPPEYQSAPLPEWAAPSEEKNDFAAALEGGEWVTDETEHAEQAEGQAAEEPTAAEDEGLGGAGGARPGD